MKYLQNYGSDTSDIDEVFDASPAAPAALAAMEIEVVKVWRASSRSATRTARLAINPLAQMTNATKRPAVSPPEIHTRSPRTSIKREF
jgi:hypothetical protein